MRSVGEFLVEEKNGGRSEKRGCRDSRRRKFYLLFLLHHTSQAQHDTPIYKVHMRFLKFNYYTSTNFKIYRNMKRILD